MSEEIKERLEKLRREYRPSMAGDVCLSWAADVAPALSEALALITSLTAELTAARAEVERLQDDLTEYRLAVTEMDSLAAGPGGLVAPLATLKKIAAIGERALTPAEEGGTGMSESEAWSEADCLAYDPFAGDDYGNDFVDFGAKIVNGRKVYQCHICQGPIAKGERHRVDSCILDGERLHARFCGICCAAMAISSEDGGEAITAREPEFQPPLLDDPLMTTPDLEGLAKWREEIARIIDPSAWTTLDMLYAELVQRGGKPNPARFKDGWSLDKADAILALFHAPAEAGGGEDEGAVRTAGAKLLTALERYGFPVSDAASTAAMSVEARDLHNAARRFKIAITSIMRPADEPAVTNGQ